MKGTKHIPEDPSVWPEEWNTIEYKLYGRFEKIKLPEPNISIDFMEMLSTRKSVRAWSKEPISLQEISNILNFSCGTSSGVNSSKIKRYQPSAGARYPLELYIINFISGELKEGIYHYNVLNKELDILWGMDTFDLNVCERVFSYPWAKEAALGIFITGIPHRVEEKYGERGYRYLYLEAGAVMNNIHLISSVKGLGSVILGGTNDGILEKVLDIDGKEETLIIGLAVGKNNHVV